MNLLLKISTEHDLIIKYNKSIFLYPAKQQYNKRLDSINMNINEIELAREQEGKRIITIDSGLRTIKIASHCIREAHGN